MPDRPTIFALSSGRPPAAIAVIRISGPREIPEPRGHRYQVWKIAGGMRLTVKLAGVPENGGNKPA
jgi:hypothetical protein